MTQNIAVPFSSLEQSQTIHEKEILISKGDKLERISVVNFAAEFQLISKIAIPIHPDDPAPTTIGFYKPEIYSDDPGTNYPHVGDLKAVNGFDTLFYFDGNTWTDIVNEIKTKSIDDIQKTSTVGLVDTYTITFTDGSAPKTFEVKNADGTVDLDVEGGALGYDKFLNISSGEPTTISEDLGSAAFNISGEYYGLDGNWSFHPAGIATRTDYIFLQSGKKATIKAVSNNAGGVPLFVVFMADQSTVITTIFPTTQNVVQTNDYIATEDCYIVANCVSTTLLNNCGIKREILTDGTANVLLSDANKNDFKDVVGGFLGYDTANQVFEFGNKLSFKNDFNKDFAGMQQFRNLTPNNEPLTTSDSNSYLLHNYVLGDVKSISLKGRLYDDRGGHRGFLGIKADGTIEDIYTKNGITAAWLPINQTFDVSDYEKVSIAIDNSVSELVFSGKMFKADGLQSKVLDKIKNATIKDRILNGNVPTEVQGLSSQRQEVNLIKFKGQNLFYWSEGWDISIIKVGDYNIDTNTVTNATTIVSTAITGLTSPIFKCPTAFVCNQKVYLIVTAWNPNHCLIYESNDGKNFTEISRTLADVSGFKSGLFGNHWIVPQKIDGYYYWFIEGMEQPNSTWIMKLMRSQNIASGWEVVGTINGLNGNTGAKGGPCVYFHDGKFKMVYHYCSIIGSNLPTWIAYAEADFNDPLNFTQLYNPLTAITHKPFGNMTDQYADPELCEIDGRTFLFCSIVDNVTPRSIVYRWECDGRLFDILNSKL